MMSGSSLSMILHDLMFLSDAIFAGLKILIPLIFIASIFKNNSQNSFLEKLIISANLLLLAGGILFCISFISSTYRTWVSEDEFGRAAFMSILSGPHWFQIVLPVVCYGVLPNLLWFKILRHSVIVSFYIVISWFVSYFVILYLSFKPDDFLSFFMKRIDFKDGDYFLKAIIFVPLLAVVYFFVNRKRKS